MTTKNIREALNYICYPTLGAPYQDREDIGKWVDGASETMVRIALKNCIQLARTAWKDVPQSTYPPCDHYGVDSGGTDYYGTSNPPQESDWNYTYCPKCGVKL